jgi:hypothetical protein
MMTHSEMIHMPDKRSINRTIPGRVLRSSVAALANCRSVTTQLDEITAPRRSKKGSQSLILWRPARAFRVFRNQMILNLGQTNIPTPGSTIRGGSMRAIVDRGSEGGRQSQNATLRR